MAATIKDVARLAGVSVSTVSRVLTNNGYVNAETKRKVLEAIDRLQYKPNQLARGLVSRKTKTLGLILPDITNPFFPQLARAVEDVAGQKGYAVIFCNSDNDRQKEIKYFQLLQEKRVDGVILAGEIDSEPIQEIAAKGIPLVVMDARIKNPLVHTVYTDNIHGGYLATTHLIGQGFKRIAHIRGPNGSSTADDRFQGYINALKSAGLAYDPALVLTGDYHPESGYEAMKRLLAQKEPPDAVFAANDMMALGALNAITETGLKVPQDIALVGFDGIPLTKLLQPKLTTVSQPIYEIGVKATEALFQSIEQPDQPKMEIVLKPKLEPGETSRRSV